MRRTESATTVAAPADAHDYRAWSLDCRRGWTRSFERDRLCSSYQRSGTPGADLGASKSVEQEFTRAELGYVSPGRVTNSLGNSSRRLHESAFESATVFASASGSARNLSAHTGASTVR